MYSNIDSGARGGLWRVALALQLLACLAPAGAQALPAERARDLDYVATQLPRLHANFFFQLRPVTFEEAVAELRAHGAAMSDAEFFAGLAALVAMAGDSHTLLYPPAGSYPLTFRWLDDGIYATGAAPPYAAALGKRLVAAGGSSIEDAIARLAAVIPHENDQWLRFRAASYLSSPPVLQGLRIVPAGTTTTFTFQSAAGERFSLDVAPGTADQTAWPDPANGPIPFYVQDTGRNYWFRYSAPNRLLYFKYNLCVDDTAVPMEGFAARFLAVLDSNPVDTLVFDLRGNTGGSDAVIGPVALGLLARLPALAARPGFRLYDIIDKGTFSSGLRLAMQLKAPVPPEYGFDVDLPRITTVIGEDSGGPTSGYGEIVNFRLPASGLAGQYSTKFFDPPSGIASAPAFVPEVSIATRSTDYFSRHDPVLAAILARSTGAPPPPAGSAIVVNGASFRTDQGIAPGSYATVFGAFAALPDQVSIGSTATPVIAASSSQANFLVPLDAAPGRTTVSVRAAGRELASGSVSISAAGPGIFVLNGVDPSQPGAVENQDYSVNSATSPAAPGSVLQIFATGAPPAEAPPTVAVYAGGIPAEVVYSGPSGYPGLWQINAIVPGGVSGQVPLYVVSHGLVSNSVTVWIR